MANMAAFDLDLSTFPKLKLDKDDLSGSFKMWLVQFRIVVEVTNMRLGKERVGDTDVDVLRGRIKLLVLLSAIGAVGLQTLQSVGFDLDSVAADSYDTAVNHLRTHYERQESYYDKAIKFATVSQACDEDEIEYLLRVEGLSRTVEFGAADDLRQRFSVALAVSGLRDSSLRRSLLQEAEVSWINLTA